MEIQANKRKQAIVIHSPHSGRADQLSRALSLLEQAGMHILETISIAELDHLAAQGTHWQELGAEVAIAAGGDGLVGGVITHIAESSLPLGILPLGTSNDIARSLNIPLNLAETVRVIVSGHEQAVDVGVAKPAEQAPHRAVNNQEDPVLTHVSPQKHGYFAHALTIGLNVQFARLATNVATRQRFGHMAYPAAALEVLTHHEPLEISLQLDGVIYPKGKSVVSADSQITMQGRVLQVAIINAPIFGGQFQLSIPGASFEDRLLDVVLIEDIDRERINETVAQFFQRHDQLVTPQSNNRQSAFARHPAELTGLPGMHHFQAQGITITTSADPRDMTLDGEVRGQTPLHAHLADKRLNVLVP
jgi:diacylglycerol kinase (ATP)